MKPVKSEFDENGNSETIIQFEGLDIAETNVVGPSEKDAYIELKELFKSLQQSETSEVIDDHMIRVSGPDFSKPVYKLHFNVCPNNSISITVMQSVNSGKVKIDDIHNGKKYTHVTVKKYPF